MGEGESKFIASKTEPCGPLHPLAPVVGGGHLLKVIRAPAGGRHHAEREGILADVLAWLPEQTLQSTPLSMVLQIFPCSTPQLLWPLSPHLLLAALLASQPPLSHLLNLPMTRPQSHHLRAYLGPSPTLVQTPLGLTPPGQ